MDKLNKKTKQQGRQRQGRDCVSVQMSMSMQCTICHMLKLKGRSTTKKTPQKNKQKKHKKHHKNKNHKNKTTKKKSRKNTTQKKKHHKQKPPQKNTQKKHHVSILSCTQTRFSRPRPRPRPSHHLKTPTNTTTGWLFASRSSWTLRHTGGSRQDTHGTPVPEKEVRGWPTRDDFRQTTRRHRPASRQTCCQRDRC